MSSLSIYVLFITCADEEEIHDGSVAEEEDRPSSQSCVPQGSHPNPSMHLLNAEELIQQELQQALQAWIESGINTTWHHLLKAMETAGIMQHGECIC